MKLSVKEIADLLNGQVIGDETLEIHQLSGLEQATTGALSFFSNQKYKKKLLQSDASCILVSEDFNLKINQTHIRVKDPYLSFLLLLTEYQRFHAIIQVGIEQPSVVHPSAALGKNVFIGAFSYIGNNVQLGENVKVFPQVYIGNNVTIGDNTILFPGVKIHSRCSIGSHCTLQAGAVIGSYGFGYVPDAKGSLQAIPQIGNVILEDHVDIGANATIDCATVDSTIIRKGVKIDNLVQIAHNVEIGEHSVMASQTGISGSTKIGKHVTLAGQVGVAGHIEVADFTKAGGKAGITHSILEPNHQLSGPFAFEHAQNLKSYALYKMLPHTMDRIKALEEKILNLNR